MYFFLFMLMSRVYVFSKFFDVKSDARVAYRLRVIHESIYPRKYISIIIICFCEIFIYLIAVTQNVCNNYKIPLHIVHVN